MNLRAPGTRRARPVDANRLKVDSASRPWSQACATGSFARHSPFDDVTRHRHATAFLGARFDAPLARASTNSTATAFNTESTSTLQPSTSSSVSAILGFLEVPSCRVLGVVTPFTQQVTTVPSAKDCDGSAIPRARSDAGSTRPWTFPKNVTTRPRAASAPVTKPAKDLPQPLRGVVV